MTKDGPDRQNHVVTCSDVEKETGDEEGREMERPRKKTEHINNRAKL